MTNLECYLVKLLQPVAPLVRIEEAKIKRTPISKVYYLEVYPEDFWFFFRYLLRNNHLKVDEFPHCFGWDSRTGPAFETKEDLVLWICRVAKASDAVTKMLLLAVRELEIG